MDSKSRRGERMMGQLFDFQGEKQRRRPNVGRIDPSNLPPHIQDQIDSGPPLRVSKPFEKMSAAEIAAILAVNNLANSLIVLEEMVTSKDRPEEEIVQFAQELNDWLNSMDDEKRSSVFDRIAEIKVYEKEVLRTMEEK